MKLSRTSIKNRIFCCFALLQKGVSSIEYHPKRVGGDPGEYQFSSVAQLYPTLCDTMDCSMPGLPAAAAAKLLQSCPTLCDPIDCSLPGSSIHGIFQARVLEWGAVAFSEQTVWTWAIPGALFPSWNVGLRNALPSGRPE